MSPEPLWVALGSPENPGVALMVHSTASWVQNTEFQAHTEPGWTSPGVDPVPLEHCLGEVFNNVVLCIYSGHWWCPGLLLALCLALSWWCWETGTV